MKIRRNIPVWKNSIKCGYALRQTFSRQCWATGQRRRCRRRRRHEHGVFRQLFSSLYSWDWLMVDSSKEPSHKTSSSILIVVRTSISTLFCSAALSSGTYQPRLKYCIEFKIRNALLDYVDCDTRINSPLERKSMPNLILNQISCYMDVN